MKLHYIKNYDRVLFQLLFRERQYCKGLYLSQTGKPCIGYNFNLQVSEVFLYVLEALGFDIHGKKLNGEALVTEYYYIGLLQKTLTDTHTNADALKRAVNDILVKRREDSRYPPFTTTCRVDNFVINREGTATGIASSLIKLFEKRVDDWLTSFDFDILKSNSYLLMRNSNERATLVSLAAQGILQLCNGNSPISLTLAEALGDNDRAESWYIIRYNLFNNIPDTDSSPNHAVLKLRYYESELFGLYDEGIDEHNISREHCKSIYGMFNRHKSRIMNHERLNRPLISKANDDFKLDKPNKIRTLEESFKIAYNYVRSDNYLSKISVPKKKNKPLPTTIKHHDLWLKSG
ncbi:MAG: hypothetical protein GXP08_05785 [Gammaproteobacteria bacterium]|nr:hypothetical protein [Gammaproteobacteria bacterium]